MVAVTGNWCTHTPAKGCSYSFIRYVNNIVLFNPHFPSFCRVSKKFTMSQVEFMPMRLKPTPPSQRIRGSSLWPLTMAGNFSYIIGNSLVVDQCLNSELNFLSHTVYQKFWDPYGGNVYSYFCIKKRYMRICFIEWTVSSGNFCCDILRFWMFLTCQLSPRTANWSTLSLPPFVGHRRMTSQWQGSRLAWAPCRVEMTD